MVRYSQAIVFTLAVCVGMFFTPFFSWADSNAENFEAFTPGSVSGQGGWTVTGPYDQEVVLNSSAPASFGAKSFRISNAVTSGSFGDQTFAKPLTDSVGETAATAGSFSEGTRGTHFQMQFDIYPASSDPQPGLAISVSPDRGDGSRMSYLRFEDNGTGIDVYFDDVSGVSSPVSFDEVKVGDNLDRSVPHTIKLSFDAVDGPSNDVVKVWIDGSLVKTGTSWENYYLYDAEASAEQTPRLIKTVLFRAGGTAVPANNGKGFLIDNFNIQTVEYPTVTLSTAAVSPVSGPFTVTATLNEPVSGFDLSDIVVGNGSASALASSSATVYTFTVTPASDGLVTVDVPANGMTDGGSNQNTASNQLSLTYAAPVINASTVVVSLSNMQGWEFNSDRNSWTMGVGKMVSGPKTAPLGNGSARITTPGANDRTKLRAYLTPGTKVSDIKTLTYDTYRANPNGGALTLALQFDVDLSSTPIDSAKADARIVYEPYFTQQAQILDDAWQTWNALDDAAGTGSGNWWIAGPNGGPTCTQANPCTWSELNTNYPDLQISGKSLENTIDTQGAVLFKAGGSWAGFDGNVDKFVIGIQNGSDIDQTTYDFEPDVSSNTVIVTAADLETETDRFAAATSSFSGKWFFYNDEDDTIDNSLGSLVDGPSGTPAGNGSAEMSVSGTERRNLATYNFKDVKLSDIETLGFSTYSQSAGNGSPASERSAYLNFNVSFDGNDTWQRRLSFVPSLNGSVVNDTWQTWDAINSGDALWTYSGANWPAPLTGTGTTPKTWNEILAAFPDAQTRSSDSFFGFRIGEPYADGFTGNVDKFIIDTNNGGAVTNATYNFEADATAPILAEVTAIGNTTDTTPDYTFSSDEDGTITYGGSCSSATTAAVAGNNTVTFDTLSLGTYTDCTVTVTDSHGNASSLLAVSSFTIEAPAPAPTNTGGGGGGGLVVGSGSIAPGVQNTNPTTGEVAGASTDTSGTNTGTQNGTTNAGTTNTNETGAATGGAATGNNNGGTITEEAEQVEAPVAPIEEGSDASQAAAAASTNFNTGLALWLALLFAALFSLLYWLWNWFNKKQS